jgi:hypothetical protein
MRPVSGPGNIQTEFTVNLGRGHLPLARSAVCVGNRLTLLDDEILGNLHRIRIQYLLLANPANLF